MNTFLSNDDLKYLGFPNIIKYSDLANYRTIEDLLPIDKSYVIVLVESQPQKGHWTCIMRYDNHIESFDSYGSMITHELDFVPTWMRNFLGENKNLLERLLKQAKKDKWRVVYNRVHFQQQKNGVNTCGRWVALRIQFMQMGYSLKQFQNFLLKQKDNTDLSYDQIVVRWVRLFNETYK